MKTPEEIEKLKMNWRRDPCWDIETTEGFEEEHDELLAYRLQVEKEQEARRKIYHDNLASKICPIMTAGNIRANNEYHFTRCQVEKCALWNSTMDLCSHAVDAYLQSRAVALAER